MTDNLEPIKTPEAPVPPPPSRERLVGVGLLIMVPSTLAGLLFGQEQASPTSAAAAPAAAAAAPAEPASAPDFKSVKSDLAELAAQLTKIHGLVEALPKPEPAPDLKAIEGKIDEISRSIASAMPLLAKVDKLGGRVSDIGKQIDGLQGEVVALKPHK